MVRKAKPQPIARPLEPDELGAAGEAYFGSLCSAGHLIANDSKRNDKMGWDYHVEFPLSHERGDLPFDSRSKMPDIKIQVKTIWADRSTVDVELPAAERLLRWEYPSFIVVLRMNMDGTYKDIIVIHLIGDNLALVLKSLRRAEAAGSRSIKNKTISFGVKHGVEVHPAGLEIANVMRRALGEEPDGYTQMKRDQLRNLGFETRRFSGSFSMDVGSDDEALDVLLGLKKGRVTRFDADEVRFAIPLPKIRSDGGSIEFKPKSRGACQFVMVAAGGERRRVIFDGDFYFASTNSNPDGLWKVRFHSPIAELLCRKDEKNVSLTIGVPPDVRRPLRDWIKVARAEAILWLGRAEAYLEKDGVHLLSFDMVETPSAKKKEKAERKIKFLNGFDSILRDVDAADVELSHSDVNASMGPVNFILDAQKPENDLKFSLKINRHNEVQDIPSEVEGLLISWFTVDGITIAFWAVSTVLVAAEPSHFNLECTRINLRDFLVLSESQTIESFVSEISAETGINFVLRLHGITEEAEDD